ncbi:MAG TPA: glycosyltransferase family 39 protein [Ramlibacter sp.]
MTRDRGRLLLAFAWLAATAWLRPLAVPDEGRYVGVAWDMLRSGDWLVPRLDGLPYFHKPPLFYWLTAATLSVNDSSLLAARVAPWIGGCLAAASMFLFVRRWVGREFALRTLLALVTAPLIFFGSQYANLDMLVAGCITATIVAFAHAALLDPDGRGRRPALLAAYALCALGVLAKGLIGIVLPGMVLFSWLVWERRWMPMLRLLWWPGIVLFFVIAAPWFVLMQERFPDFMHYFFVVQHFQRFATSGFNNPRPFWFYPAVLLVLSLPWTLWLLRAKVLAWRGPDVGSSVRRLMLVWLLSITLFFSLPTSKLVGYILPVAAPLVYLCVDTAFRLGKQRLWRASAIAAALLCLGSAVAIDVTAHRPQIILGTLLRQRLQPGDTVISLDDYRFAIPFEARLRSPMLVVSDWSPESVASRDNWRRELADAAVFEPKQDWLISEAQLVQRVCTAQANTWLVGDDSVAAKYQWLGQAEKVAEDRRLALWRVAPAAPLKQGLCRGTPSASSGGKS